MTTFPSSSPRPPRRHVISSRSALLLASALAASVSVSGCASLIKPPVSTPAVDVPTQWSSDAPNASTSTSAPATGSVSANPAILSTWWTQFNDPILTELIQEALLASPDIRTARSRIEVARAQLSVTRANGLPTVSASVSGSGSESRDHATDISSSSEGYSASLGASWEIDLFGQQHQSNVAADADFRQSIDAFHAVQVSLSAEIANTYLNLRTAEARLALNERTRQSREQTLQLVQWRAQAGIDDSLAIQQALTALEQSNASRPSLQQSVSTYRNQLALLCGRTPGSLDDRLGTSDQLPTMAAVTAVGIPADTLRQRPDVRSASLAVKAAAARLTAAQLDRLPSLSLSGSLSANAAHPADLFSPATTIANLAGNLTAPLFNAGRITQNIRIQDETTQQALFAYESTVLSALNEVQNALTALNRSQEQFDAVQRAAVPARATNQLAHLRYEAGQTDFLTVLDAERTLVGIEDNLVTAASNQTAAQIQLYRALGGGWTVDPTLLADAR